MGHISWIAIVEYFYPKATEMNNNSPLNSMIEQMLTEAKSEASQDITDEQVSELAREFWAWAKTIPSNGRDLRLRAVHDGLCLEVIGPDRPFLVDSLLGACTQLGHEVLALFHPIVELEDGTHRSLIHIQLPNMIEADQAALLEEARVTLEDVVIATTDYHAMRDRMASEVEALLANPYIDDYYKSEAAAFLKWLGNEHFVFLGVRDYTFHLADDGSVLPEEPEMVPDSNLGILRNEARNVLNRGSEPLVISQEIGDFLVEPEPLILAKSTLTSRVHRRVFCDYVGVKHFGVNGQVTGETRFLGLYTSEAYNNSVRDVPMLRRRFNKVIEASGAAKGTYTAKALSNIMEAWPRDELIQTNSETLAPTMLGVLQLIGRPRVRVFARYDRFKRFVSVVTFVPREAYDTNLRRKITDLLETSFTGRLASFEPSFDATSMVRILFEVALSSHSGQPDLMALEKQLAQICRTWDERFRRELMNNHLGTNVHMMASLFTGAFNAAYREAFTPEEALLDVVEIEKINSDHPVKLRAYRVPNDDDTVIRAKIYARNGSIALSDCVPVFEQMGLFVNFETGYPIRPHGKAVEDAPDVYWIHSLSMKLAHAQVADLDEIAKRFEDAFVAVWSGRVENDGFNALVFNAGLTWREADLCRALSAYRHQTGLDPARSTQVEALNANPELTRCLIDLFAARFDPAVNPSADPELERLTTARTRLDEGLKTVSSLDHDRVIRRIADLILAIQRTNFYQVSPQGEARPFIAFKIASRELVDLPAPKPYREIFMASPLVEGVHCRFGAVARGGLRWSDRRDDFRTEVLGLVKAQQVKNAVIVPVGSKGGFFPKQLPLHGSREDIREAGIAAYRSFITALLDLTDNLIDGKVVAPLNTTIWDGEDPYLVVAADKGTATFSDIANEISEAHGFWLGDAFASGGSVGYDHKKMGITARGAWEAVKRHFREIGTDIQTEPFSVIGCGDMSGDVFGNGMLLSQQTRLMAAFNHMHIFIDPEPQEPERLWQERQRLFNLPRSTWMDYDQTLISEGGGIFERSAKSIPMTAQMKTLTGLSRDEITPDELIHALLKSECDLLWFGGIGTYIKASHETHAAAGDRINDALRVDGRQVRAKVIGEGANLGATQAGRIEFAQAGGRLNTDAIDNSAGVDSSDHEVNIKILCTEAMRQGELPRGERNSLLASMTDDVATHVLRHNYAQTAALSLAQNSAREDHDALERLMVELETRGVLDRAVEGLPSTADMQARLDQGQPLTRPELAVIMAWTKIVLFDDLTASSVPDDPHFVDTLRAYFPEALRKYEAPMQGHRLKREIIATVLANRSVDISGPVLLLRLHEQTGADFASIAAALETARVLLDVEALQDEIDALDCKAPAQHQIKLQSVLAEAMAQMAVSLLQNQNGHAVNDILDELSPHLPALKGMTPKALNSFEAGRFNRLVRSLSGQGVTVRLATRVAATMWLGELPNLSRIAEQSNVNIRVAFATCQTVGDSLFLDRLRAAARQALRTMPYWDRLATRRLVRDLQQLQNEAVHAALETNDPQDWLQANAEQRKELIADLKMYTSNKPVFAQFALATTAVRSFMQASTQVS